MFLSIFFGSRTNINKLNFLNNIMHSNNVRRKFSLKMFFNFYFCFIEGHISRRSNSVSNKIFVTVNCG